MAVSVGDKIAPLIGARPGEISLHQNVTLIEAVISSCFDFRGPRNKIVMVDLEFPSIQYFYHEQRRLGARVEVVPSENPVRDRKSTRLNSSHVAISYAVFCLKKKK